MTKAGVASSMESLLSEIFRTNWFKMWNKQKLGNKKLLKMTRMFLFGFGTNRSLLDFSKTSRRSIFICCKDVDGFYHRTSVPILKRFFYPFNDRRGRSGSCSRLRLRWSNQKSEKNFFKWDSRNRKRKQKVFIVGNSKWNESQRTPLSLLWPNIGSRKLF